VLTPNENPGFVANGSPLSSIVDDSMSLRPIPEILVLFIPKELSSKKSLACSRKLTASEVVFVGVC